MLLVTEPKDILRRASNGANVTLGQVLGRGGEGTVHAVNGAPRLVAKIYTKPPDAPKVEKLRLMMRGQSEALLGVAAWPTDLLVDERGAVRGFVMSRISARQDAHRLYSPKSRRRTFPDADFRFVVRAATNMARAFAQIHAAGHVIGDVNHGNALIGKDGTAILIDCDSIQVTERGRTFTCDVGSPLFTPPELQNKRFRGLTRTANQDCFGLAALLFHFLFQGRHPFAGRFADGEMPIERAIAESRFAYGANAASFGMSAPPATLPLGAFGEEIASLFERAFAPPGGADRPTAVEWIGPLERLEKRLAACTTRPRHFHPGDAPCCWCEIEALSGARLFDESQTATEEVDAMTAQALWNAIEGVPEPPAHADTPPFVTDRNAGIRVTEFYYNLARVLVPAGLLVGFATAITNNSAGLFAATVAVACTIFASVGAAKSRVIRAKRAAKLEWLSALEQWRHNTSATAFFRVRAQLADLRGKLNRLGEQRMMELDRLSARISPHLREAHLKQFEVDTTTFFSVTSSQLEKLMSHGIRSAADVLRLDARGGLHKFVKSSALGELRAWARQCAAQFKMDVNDPLFSAEAAKIEEQFRQQRLPILEQLRHGPQELASTIEEISEARARAEIQLKTVHEKLKRTRGLEKQ